MADGSGNDRAYREQLRRREEEASSPYGQILSAIQREEGMKAPNREARARKVLEDNNKELWNTTKYKGMSKADTSALKTLELDKILGGYQQRYEDRITGYDRAGAEAAEKEKAKAEAAAQAAAQAQALRDKNQAPSSAPSAPPTMATGRPVPPPQPMAPPPQPMAPPPQQPMAPPPQPMAPPPIDPNYQAQAPNQNNQNMVAGDTPMDTGYSHWSQMAPQLEVQAQAAPLATYDTSHLQGREARKGAGALYGGATETARALRSGVGDKYSGKGA